MQRLRKYMPSNGFHEASRLVGGIVSIEGDEKLGYMVNGYVLVKQIGGDQTR